jgi:hypothetical protein
METVIEEVIKVGAVFENNVIRPKWFVWSGVRRDVKEINYNWKSRTGNTLISYFSVYDGSAHYLLSFNHTTLEWKLEKQYAE